MQSIRQVQRLNDTELQSCVAPSASWHTDYRDTAYIYIGGLPFELSEGDVLTIFSQYGNPVHINLVRDKETGKSRGFCFLKYEDQRSCDLAVDNLSGAGVMGRVISVDHTRYKKKEGEIEGVGDDVDEGQETDTEGAGRQKRRRTESESEGEKERPVIKEEVELQKLLREHDDDDPMKAYLVKEKKAEVEQALQAVAMRNDKVKGRKHRHHRSRRDDDDSERHAGSNGHRRRQDGSDDEENERQYAHRARRKLSTTPDSDEGDRESRRRRSKKDERDEDDNVRHRTRDRSRPKHHDDSEDGQHGRERHRRR